MQIVIDIDNDIAHGIIDGQNDEPRDIVRSFQATIADAIKNGTPLPKGHGRLIDADALEKKMCDREMEMGDDQALWESSAVSVALDMFAPTVIESVL
jgi:hypothetical protein